MMGCADTIHMQATLKNQSGQRFAHKQLHDLAAELGRLYARCQDI